MTGHLLRMGGIVMLLALSVIYPFLPGSYDPLAVPVSTMVQGTVLLASMLVAPLGALWLVAEARRRSHAFGFGLAALIASSLIAAAVVLMAFATVGMSMALPFLAAGLYMLSRSIRHLRRLKDAPRDRFNPTPLYLVVVPLAVLLFQIAVARPATDTSRKRAIAAAAEIITEIESYRARQGRYPASLHGIWKDYDPSVVGVERFYYSSNGEAYDLFFEQPRFVHDPFGTREFVVYNPRDEHVIVSHTASVLDLTPEQWRRYQGWYSAHDTPSPHWKYFWFD